MQKTCFFFKIKSCFFVFFWFYCLLIFVFLIFNLKRRRNIYAYIVQCTLQCIYNHKIVITIFFLKSNKTKNLKKQLLQPLNSTLLSATVQVYEITNPEKIDTPNTRRYALNFSPDSNSWHAYVPACPFVDALITRLYLPRHFVCIEAIYSIAKLRMYNITAGYFYLFVRLE